MDDDDEFGDLYSDVLNPFKSPFVTHSSPPPYPPNPPIDLNLRSHDHDSFSRDGRPGGASATVSSVLENEPPKLPTIPSGDAIDTAVGGKDLTFDIEEGNTDPGPVIPGLSVAASAAESLPLLATDQVFVQSYMNVKGGDGIAGEGEGPDWDSDSGDDLQIVLNNSSRNGTVGGGRRPRVGDDEEDDDDDEDDEEPLVIVADTDTDPNQALEDQLWGEDVLQAAEGECKDASEAGKASGVGAAAAPKIGYSSHGYHPFHSQFKVSVNATLLLLVCYCSGQCWHSGYFFGLHEVWVHAPLCTISTKT